MNMVSLRVGTDYDRCAFSFYFYFFGDELTSQISVLVFAFAVGDMGVI